MDQYDYLEDEDYEARTVPRYYSNNDFDRDDLDNLE